MAKRHLVIPDTQVKPGVRTDHFDWIGRYIVEKQPDVIVHLGDHWDMPSLSSYDRGKRSFEGRRYKADIQAGNDALGRLMAPLRAYNANKARLKERQYRPRLVILRGNHEHRIERAVEDNAQLEGVIGYHDFADGEWERVPFLQPIIIDGVAYVHYSVLNANGDVMQAKNGQANARTQLNREMRTIVCGHKQGLDVANRPAHGRLLWSIIVGSCLAPWHKVLTADLRYVPLGDVRVGDKLVSFDELPGRVVGARNGPRRFRTGTVEAVRMARAPMFDVELSSGKVFRATGDHLWLTKNSGSLYSWRRTDELRRTSESALGGKGGGTRIVKLLPEFEHATSWESGWLAGMYDGEGSLYHRRTTGGSVLQLSLSQSESHNPDLCRIIEGALRDVCGVQSGVSSAIGRSVNYYRICGGAREAARVLGTVRPNRMLSKFTPEMLGSLTGKHPAEPEYIVSICPAGEGDNVQIAIDTRTMVVEGYGHHNCYQHDEEYLTPQGNHYWRGIVMLNDVRNGEFEPMPLTLDYLCRRYTGRPLLRAGEVCHA